MLHMLTWDVCLFLQVAEALAEAKATRLDCMEVDIVPVDMSVFYKAKEGSSEAEKKREMEKACKSEKAYVVIGCFTKGVEETKKKEVLFGLGKKTVFRTAALAESSRCGRKEIDTRFVDAFGPACKEQLPVDPLR